MVRSAVNGKVGGSRPSLGANNPLFNKGNILKVVLIDMDNTIVNFDKRFDEQWQKKYPDLPFIPCSERKSFHIEKSFPKELENNVLDIFHEPGFFRQLEPIEHAVNALHDIDGAGFEIKLCTAPLTEAPNCMTEKYEWVKEHLGKRWLKKLIITDDKTMIKGKVLIDDKPNIVGNYTPEWIQVYFDTSYNRACGGQRIISWKYAKDFLINYMFKDSV